MTPITSYTMNLHDLFPVREDIGTGNEGPARGVLNGSSFELPATGRPAHAEVNAVASLRLAGEPSTDIPRLAPPPASPGMSDMIALLQQISAKSQQLQIRNVAARLQLASGQIDRNTELQVGRIGDWIKRTEEANPGFFSKLLGWAGKVAAVLGAAAGVVFSVFASGLSAGAAAPLLLFSITALVGAALSLADHVSKSCGGGRVSIGDALAGLSANILEACGVAPEKAKELGSGMAGCIALAVPVLLLVQPQLAGNAAGGLARLMGANPSTAQYIEMGVGTISALALGVVFAAVTFGAGTGLAVANASASLRSTYLVISGVNAVSQGGVALAEGGTTLRAAFVQKQADDAMAARRSLQGDMAQLQHSVRIDRDIAAKIYQQIATGTKGVSRLISQAAENQMLILGNLGGHRSV